MVVSKASETFEQPYGKTLLRYTIHRSERESLRISVHPDRRIEVHAPSWATDDELAKRVHRRASWIKRQLDFFLSFEPRHELKEYVPGESHRYLGRRYRIRWLLGPKGASPACRLRGAYFEVSATDRTSIQPAVEQWFADRAQVKLPEIAAPWIKQFEELHNVQPKQLIVRSLSVRWGSCTPSGRITLNLELIRHAHLSIEYVVVHELCHLVEPNHTKAFWILLKRTLPDWEARKRGLERSV